MMKFLIVCISLACAPNSIASAADLTRLTLDLFETIEAMLPEDLAAERTLDDRAIVMHARLIKINGGLAEAAWITGRREARAGRKEDARRWIDDAEKASRYIGSEIPKLLKSIAASRRREREDIRALAERTLYSAARFSDELRQFQESLQGEPNQPPQRNAGSRPSSNDSPASETQSSLGPRG